MMWTIESNTPYLMVLMDCHNKFIKARNLLNEYPFQMYLPFAETSI